MKIFLSLLFTLPAALAEAPSCKGICKAFDKVCLDSGFLNRGCEQIFDKCESDQCECCHFRRVRLLTESYDETPSKEQALKIIAAYRGNPDASFVVEHDLLPKESCEVLAKYTESSLHNDESPLFPFGEEANVYKKMLGAHDLIDLIGKDNTLCLIDFFEEHRGKDEPITEVYLARHTPSMKEDPYYTPWHKDCYSAMEVQVGSFEEGDEWLVHLTRDGAQKYKSYPGTAMVHGQDILHGTPPFYGDEPKYLLVLKHHPKDILNKHPKETILTKDIVNEYIASSKLQAN